jgi:hypothetical protein
MRKWLRNLIFGSNFLWFFVFPIRLKSIAQFNLNNIEKIIKIIEKFSGLKHRLQNIRNIDSINFINDSKATNAESTENALKAYDNIFWILGFSAVINPLPFNILSNIDILISL